MRFPVRHFVPFARLTLAMLLLSSATTLHAQLSFSPKPSANPLTDPGLLPGTAFLFQLDAKFAHDTEQGGGPAFASWFAQDGVTLANGKAPVTGRDAIAKSATWKAEDYRLTWTPDAGQLSPDGDMGYTWGSYQGTAKDAYGKVVLTKGRYLTIWKKQPDGTWKVELDASNDGPPAEGDCCRLP